MRVGSHDNLFPLIRAISDADGYFMDAAGEVFSIKRSNKPIRMVGTTTGGIRYITITSPMGNSRAIRHTTLVAAAKAHPSFSQETATATPADRSSLAQAVATKTPAVNVAVPQIAAQWPFNQKAAAPSNPIAAAATEPAPVAPAAQTPPAKLPTLAPAKPRSWLIARRDANGMVVMMTPSNDEKMVLAEMARLAGQTPGAAFVKLEVQEEVRLNGLTWS